MKWQVDKNIARDGIQEIVFNNTEYSASKDLTEIFNRNTSILTG